MREGHVYNREGACTYGTPRESLSSFPVGGPTAHTFVCPFRSTHTLILSFVADAHCRCVCVCVCWPFVLLFQRMSKAKRDNISSLLDSSSYFCSLTTTVLYAFFEYLLVYPLCTVSDPSTAVSLSLSFSSTLEFH